jgi:hypothetical protein
MEEFRIPNQTRGHTIFSGTHLAHSDSRRAHINPSRWVEMDLYRTQAGHYILDRIGVSRVYHTFDSDCDRGVRTAINNMPEGAVPCFKCNPSLLAGIFVDMEEDRHELNDCATAEDVLAALITTRNKGAIGTPFLSYPAKRLLELASEEDAGIRIASQKQETRIA